MKVYLQLGLCLDCIMNDIHLTKKYTTLFTLTAVTQVFTEIIMIYFVHTSKKNYINKAHVSNVELTFCLCYLHKKFDVSNQRDIFQVCRGHRLDVLTNESGTMFLKVLKPLMRNPST